MKPESHSLMVPARTRKSLDVVQLQSLEHSFRVWAQAPLGVSRRLSRKRVLLIFLLIRYTGAKLNEILTLQFIDQIDLPNRKVLFHKGDSANGITREVQIPELLADELKNILEELRFSSKISDLFKIDPAHVRRKFYECAEATGIPRELGTPEAIRRSRGVELMQNNVPLPVVQKIMGHSTPNLAASYIAFSEEEIKKAQRFHIERENKRKTSARNSFFGKIDKVRIGDVQAGIEMISLDGYTIFSVVTRDSQNRLGLERGRLVAVEVKAPLVVLYKGDEEPACSAENRFKGSVVRVIKGKVNSEVVVRISETTELCSILTEKCRESLKIEKGETVWAVFNATMAVIHVD